MVRVLFRKYFNYAGHGARNEDVKEIAQMVSFRDMEWDRREVAKRHKTKTIAETRVRHRRAGEQNRTWEYWLQMYAAEKWEAGWQRKARRKEEWKMSCENFAEWASMGWEQKRNIQK